MSFNEWKRYKLEDFAEVQNGYAFKSEDFVNTGTPIIKIKNLVPPKVSFEECQYFNSKIGDRLTQFLIRKNDILISMTGSHINQIASAVGKVSRYQFDSPALLNQRVGKVYVKKQEIASEDYLYYFLSRFETQFELAASAGGSANQANISPSHIKQLEISLPNLKSQNRIAYILSSLDDKIENNLAINQTLEEIARRLFKEWFVNFNYPGAVGKVKASELGEMPDGWQIGTLEDIAGQVKESVKPLSQPEKEFYHYSLPAFDLDELPSRDFGSTILSNKTAVKKYSVLFSKLNPRIPRIWAIGDIEEERSICSTEFIGFTPKQDFFYSFLNYFLKQPELISKLSSIATGTSNSHQRIKPTDLLGLQVLIPDYEIVRNFERIVKPMLETRFHKILENQQLKTIRDSLIPRLMSGEIEVNGK